MTKPKTEPRLVALLDQADRILGVGASFAEAFRDGVQRGGLSVGDAPAQIACTPGAAETFREFGAEVLRSGALRRVFGRVLVTRTEFEGRPNGAVQRTKSEIGNAYGRLVVTGPAPSRGNGARWRCLCECGRTVDAQGTALRASLVKSCGCAQTARDRRGRWGKSGAPARPSRGSEVVG